MPRKITLDQFLTPEEIQKAIELFNSVRDRPTHFNRLCVEQIIKPNIKRINADLGQQNDPSYLAYAVEFVLGKKIG